MSIYGCFQSAHFPGITIGRHCDTFRNPLPYENSFDALDGSASIKSALVQIPSVPVYTREKREYDNNQTPAFPSERSARLSVVTVKDYRLRRLVRPGRRTLDKKKKKNKPLIFKLRKGKEKNGTDGAVECSFIFIYRVARLNALHIDGNIELSITLPSIASRSIAIASAPQVISLAKMTMRSDVWHLCITQDEFGVRVSALATKI